MPNKDSQQSVASNEDRSAAKPVIFRSGNFLTMDPKRPRASVLAALGGRLTYVGDDFRDALATLPAGAEVVDLKGRHVVPGLIDSHAHLVHEGLKLGQLDVSGLSLDETAEKVAQEAARRPPGSWIHGRGWDQNLWPGQRWPSREGLDMAAPDHPTVLDRIDKHSLWVNSAALKLAGVEPDGPEDPEGGEILRRSDGAPTGVLVGQAMFLVLDVMPPLDGGDWLEIMLKGQEEAIGCGLTTMIDCGVRPDDVRRFERAASLGLLKLRVRLNVVADPWPEELLAGGPVNDLCGGRLSIDGVKIFSDGSLGSWSAWLKQDYADGPGRRGGRNYDDAALEALLVKASDLGLQACVHVIGDEAVSQTVSAMERVLGPERTDRRWRLEHCQVVSVEDRERIISMGLIPSIQSVGLMTDLHMAGDRLGPERLKRAYAWREVIDRGGIVVNGSDCPVESLNPFLGLYAAVTRKDLKGRPEGGFAPEHALSRLEALASYTRWAAWAAFQENSLGALSPGKLCDLAVLDRDILTCPERAIAGTRVLATVSGGEVVYGR